MGTITRPRENAPDRNRVILGNCLLVITVTGGLQEILENFTRFVYGAYEGLGNGSLVENKVQPVEVGLIRVGRCEGVLCERGTSASRIVNVGSRERYTLSVL